VLCDSSAMLLLTYRGNGKVVDSMLKSGEMESAEVGGVRYLWPAGRLCRNSGGGGTLLSLRFDPLVWDRAPLRIFWAGPYLFELYSAGPNGSWLLCDATAVGAEVIGW